MRDYKLGFNRHSRSTPRPVSDVEPIPTFSGELYGAFQVLEEATRGRNLEGKYRTQYTVSGACPIAGHCAKLFSSRADAMQDQRNIMATAYNRSVEYLDAQDELSRLEHAPITLGESTCPNGCTSPCVPAESTQPVPAPRDVTPANVALLLAMERDPADSLDDHNIIRPRHELYPQACEGYCRTCGRRENPLKGISVTAQDICRCHGTFTAAKVVPTTVSDANLNGQRPGISTITGKDYSKLGSVDDFLDSLAQKVGVQSGRKQAY